MKFNAIQVQQLRSTQQSLAQPMATMQRPSGFANADSAEEVTQQHASELHRDHRMSAGKYSHSEYLEQLEYWSGEASIETLATELAEMARDGSRGDELTQYLLKYADPLERYLMLRAAIQHTDRFADAEVQRKARQSLDAASEVVWSEHRSTIEAGFAMAQLDGKPRMPLAEARVMRGWVEELRREGPLVDTMFKMVADCGTPDEFKRMTHNFLVRVGPEICRASSLSDPSHLDDVLSAIRTAHELLFAFDIAQDKPPRAMPRARGR